MNGIASLRNRVRRLEERVDSPGCVGLLSCRGPLTPPEAAAETARLAALIERHRGARAVYVGYLFDRRPRCEFG